MKDQVQYFEDKFGDLIDKACQEIIGKIEPHVFRSHIMHSTQNRSFVEEKLTNIPPPVTFVKIWSTLNCYCDFLNYGLLEHVINTCGSQDLKQKMQNYVDELSTFKQQTQLCDFIESWSCRDDGQPEGYFKEVVVKMQQKEWSQCTLQDVESFKKVLVHKFTLPEIDLLLKKTMEGCVCVWLTSPSTATSLQENLLNISSKFFQDYGVDAVTIDGQDVYLTPVKKYSGYLRDLYNSEQRPVGICPSSAEKLLPFKLARIEKEKVKARVDDHEYTKQNLRGDMDDVGCFGAEVHKKSPIEFEEVGKLSNHHRQKLILIEGAPGVGKTTFSWEFCRKWGRGEILQGTSLLLLLPLRDNNLRETKTFSDFFYHRNSDLQQAVIQEVTNNQGQGVAIWLDAWDELDHESREQDSVFLDLIHGKILRLATVFVTSRPWASEYLRKNYGCRISQHVEILGSAKDQIEYYTSKTKFTDYLSSNPVVRAAMYTPVTAKMTAEVFTWSLHTESPPPTTMTELFTAFTLKTLVEHLSTHPVYQKQQLKVTTFNNLPTDVWKQFQDLCRMAYGGIMNRQLVFTSAHVPTGFSPLDLMQEVPQLYTEGRTISYNFIHLTLQEYLAAFHISQLPAHEQTRLFQKHINRGHFIMTLRFLAGLTKLTNVPHEIPKGLTESDDTKPILFHFLFEAKDTSVTTSTLDSDQIVVRPHYSWNPLDYYVTGYAISHSNCPWTMYFSYSSIDDYSFELFCQGCTAPVGFECSGHISHANFSVNAITSKSMQSFVNIPPHILKNIRELELHHNKLDASACELLAKAISSMFRLRKLWLSYNPIGSGGAVEVIKALCSSGLKLLWLDNTGIGVPDCEALCELLELSTSLQQLLIDQNSLSSKSVARIITGLSRNSSLTHLKISNSHFSFPNVASLAAILGNQSKCTLAHLEIRDCQITELGANKLASALHKNKTLKHLNLNRNQIGVEGVSDMLKHNTSLEVLHLRDDSFEKEDVHQLVNSLQHNQTLKKVYLPEKYKTENGDHRIEWW